MQVTAGKVLQHYYALRAKRGTRSPAFFRKKAWAHAEAFLKWCAKTGIEDPLRYLEFWFEVCDYTGKPPQLHRLRSNNLAETYLSEWQQDERAAEDAYTTLKQRAGTREQQAVKALRVLTHGMEAAKYPYASTGRYELCLAEVSLTGGFHPSSRYCPTCPVAVRCAAALYRINGFDVVALRAGRLHELPKHIATAAIS